MEKFVELRFGQGDLGKSLIDHRNKETYPRFVQREIIPVSSIIDMYVVLPERRNIRIAWKVGERTYRRTEYYKNEIDCIKRWCFLKNACGASGPRTELLPLPLSDDIEELEKLALGKGETTDE